MVRGDVESQRDAAAKTREVASWSKNREAKSEKRQRPKQPSKSSSSETSTKRNEEEGALPWWIIPVTVPYTKLTLPKNYPL